MPPTVWCTSFVVCLKNVIAFFAIISLPSVIALVREVLKTATVDAVGESYFQSINRMSSVDSINC